MSLGFVLMASSTAQADADPKVVVCKYVSTPGGVLDHIVVVSENSVHDGFSGSFPYQWTDAHGGTQVGSIAIRYADAGPPPEQARTIALSECPGGSTTADECEELEGVQPEGFDCIMPDEILTEDDEDLTCLQYSVTRTTTTTKFTHVPGAGGGTWVAGEPVVQSSKSTKAPTAAQIASLGDECIAGTSTTKPKPDKDKTPVVLGTQAAVPSAVSAGLGGQPPSASSPLQLLAQLMVAGGLLLLTAGGWIGLGRREAGAHQS